MASPFFTEEKAYFANSILVGLAGSGAALSFLVLLAYGIVALNVTARPHLDRVSFRLLSYAIVANMVFGVANSVCTVPTGASPGCSFVAFLLVLTLDMSSWLLFFIALNLQLVLIHGVNGQRMEKYYVVASIVMPLVQTVPTYAGQQYGWDEILLLCWYSSMGGSTRLRWQIGTQLLWSLGLVIGEVICFFTVVFYMLQHERRAVKIHKSSLTNTRSMFGSQTTTTTISHASSNGPLAHARKYRKIILRIGLYPLSACIINISTAAIDIYQSTSGDVQTNKDYHILLAGYAFYGGRAIVYALLAATDPSFIRAVRSFMSDVRGSQFDSTIEQGTSGAGTSGNAASHGISQGQLTVHIELQQVSQADNGDVIDMNTSTKSVKADSEFDLRSSLAFANIKEDSDAVEPDASEVELGLPRTGRLPSSTAAMIHARADQVRRNKEQRAIHREEAKDFKKQI